MTWYTSYNDYCDGQGPEASSPIGTYCMELDIWEGDGNQEERQHCTHGSTEMEAATRVLWILIGWHSEDYVGSMKCGRFEEAVDDHDEIGSYIVQIK